MGNSNKKPEDYEVVRSFKREQWINKEKRPNCQIWQNTTKNVHADVYPIKSDIKPVDLDHYEMRYNNSQDIVKVHNLYINQEAGLCSKPADAHVYVERIPLRLNNVQDLTQPEALSILRSCYSGFNTISTFYGPVEPYEDLICFNEQGHTKVWVNSNLATNTPAKQPPTNKVGNPANANVAYVNKILDLVETRTAVGSFPGRLKNKFRENNPKTYFEALNLVEEYAGEERIQIPNNINLRWGQMSQNRTQFQNTVSKVSAYTNGSQPGSFYQNNVSIQQSQYHPLQQSRHLVNTNQSVLSTQQNIPFNNFVQTPDFSKLRSQTSVVSFGEPLVYNDPNLRLPNVTFNSRVVAPTSPRINYPIGVPIPTTSISPRSVSIPMQGPVVNFDSPSKVITHQVIKPSTINIIQNPLKVDSPLKQPPSSPIKVTAEKNNENSNQLSAQSLRSENRYVQRVEIKPETPRMNFVNVSQQNRVVVNQINQPPRMIINAQPNYQQFSIRPQGVVSLQPAGSTIRPPAQPNFSLPGPFVNINRPPQGPPQQVRQQVIVQQLPPQQQLPLQHQLPVQQVIPTQPTVTVPLIPQPLITRVQERTQIHVQQAPIVVVQNQHEQQQKEAPKIVPSVQHQQIRPQTANINQDQGYGQGYEEDEMDRELQSLQAQHLFTNPSAQQITENNQHQDHSNHEHEQEEQVQQVQQVQENYFPFAGQLLTQKTDELRRVQTTQLRHEQFQSNQTEKQIHQPQEQYKYGGSEVRVPVEQTQRQIPNVYQNQIKQEQVVQQPQEGVQTSYDRDYTYQYQYKSSIPQVKATQRIPDDARYEDIQQYIRNKYQTYIGVGDNQVHEESSVSPYIAQVKKAEPRQMYSYVESKYDQFSNQDMQFSFRPTQEQLHTQTKQEKPSLISSYEYMRVEPMYGGPEISVETIQEIKPEVKFTVPIVEVKKVQLEDHEDDILNVKNMERSLDKKYSSMRSNQQIKDIDSVKKDQKDDNELDVKKLEQNLNLMRFQQSINHTSNISEPRFETSQVSKINSIEEKLGNRRSSMNRDFGYKDQTYEIKSYSYENQSPVYDMTRKSRTSKISKEISDIDEKFSKYVKGGPGLSSSSSKAALKPKEDNYKYRDYDNESSSRMATGHFGYTDYSKGEERGQKISKDYNREKTTFVTSDVKSPSYEDLRKYMWS